jgi:hypothetical protein
MRWVAIVVLFASCSANWHHKQACKKDSAYCNTSIVIDTFTIRDTFIHKQVDTLSYLDTIRIDTGSVRVEVIRKHDVFTTTITQKPDTSYITITKQLPPKVITKYKTPIWVYVCLGIITLLLLKIKL